MIPDEEIKRRIISCYRVALIERVTGNMRLIKFSVENGVALIEFIVDGDFHEYDDECIGEFETEMLSHFISNIVSCRKSVKIVGTEININKYETVLYARWESRPYIFYC